LEVKFVELRVTVAYPALFVVAVEELREAVP
jgi:hypothetical protein